ncbi:MAG: O-antigen ligase family protein [Planctomycetaceae bacterium]|nr:O-antigen ligase family protein [Planctomycetaceae bacterium]
MIGQLIVYALAYGGALLALVRPFHGVLIYILFAVARPTKIFPGSIPYGNYSMVIGSAFIIGWVLAGFGSWNFGRSRRVIFLIIGFFIWAILSSIMNPKSPLTASMLDNLVKIVLPFLIGLTLVETWFDVRCLAYTLAIAAGIVVFREFESIEQWGIGVGDNVKAHTFAVGTALIFLIGTDCKRWIFKLGFFGLAAIALHVCLVHMSRGAMLGLVMGGMVGFFVIEKSGKSFALIGFGCVIAAILIGPSVITEFTSTFAGGEARDASAESRFVFWAGMGRGILDKPIFGVGPRRWMEVSALYGLEANREGHNAWLQLTAETGLPGGLMIFFFYVTCIVRLLPIARGKEPDANPSARPFAQATVVTLSMWLIQQIFGSFYLLELPYYIALLGAAVLKMTDKESATASDISYADARDFAPSPRR